MATSDDELRPDGDLDEESSGEEPRQKKTLLGLGAIQRLSEPGAPRRTREDFEAEATELAPRLVESLLDDIEVDIDLAFGIDRSKDTPPSPAAPSPDEELADEFEEEATAISAELEFPDDSLEARSEPAPDDDGLEALDLVEDSHSEPIQEKTPTLDEEPSADRSWAKTEVASTFGGVPLEGDGELPTPIGGGPPSQPALVANGAAEAPIASPNHDFPDEKTEVLASVFEQEPAVGKLVTLEGPAIGHEYFATGLRNSVGRGLNNSIVVADLAMSRQHFEIFKNPDESYTLRDLQSINGTMVNGTRVREADLFHGDRVEAGKSTFQFVVTGTSAAVARQRRVVPAATATMAGTATTTIPAPARAAPASQSFSKVFLWASVAAMTLAAIVLAGVGYVYFGQETATPAAAAPQGSSVYLDGVNAVKERDWDRAQALFERARQIDPSLPGIDDQLRRIQRERIAKANLEEATAMLDRGAVDEATQRIDKIPPDSVYHVEGQTLLRGARATHVDELFAAAQEALDRDDLAGARARADEVIGLVPSHHGARRLLDRIEALENPTIEEPEDAPDSAAMRDPGPSRDPDDEFTFELIGDEDGTSPRKKKTQDSRPQGTTSGVPNFLSGFMLYRTRKFADAEKFFDDAGAEEHAAASMAREMADHIRDFRANYDAGNTALQAGQWADADARLTAARRADSKIASGKGHFDSELRAKVAEAKAQRGLEALADDDARAARKFADEARVADGSVAAVRKLDRELESLARAKFVQAANLRKSDPNGAAKLCREIKVIVPASSETYRKAEQLLVEL